MGHFVLVTFRKESPRLASTDDSEKELMFHYAILGNTIFSYPEVTASQ